MPRRDWCKCKTFGALAAAVATGQFTCLAAEPASAPAEQAPETIVKVSSAAAYQFDTDLNNDLDADGSFSQTRLGAGLSIVQPVSNSQLFLSHAFNYEYDAYDFSGTSVFSDDNQIFATSKPWSDTQLLSYTLRADLRLDHDWGIFGGPIIGASWENGANIGDALNYGGLAGVNYGNWRNFGIGLGVIVTGGLEQDVQVLPLVLLQWQITDTLALRNPRPQPGLRGTAGLELAWTFSPRWVLAVGGAYDQRRFRLDQSTSPASEGIGQNSGYPVYARLDYLPNDHWSISGLAGVLMGGRLLLETDGGHEIGDLRYDTAPMLAAAVAYRF